MHSVLNVDAWGGYTRNDGHEIDNAIGQLAAVEHLACLNHVLQTTCCKMMLSKGHKVGGKKKRRITTNLSKDDCFVHLIRERTTTTKAHQELQKWSFCGGSFSTTTE